MGATEPIPEQYSQPLEKGANQIPGATAPAGTEPIINEHKAEAGSARSFKSAGVGVEQLC
jgi:hypothetical protein